MDQEKQFKKTKLGRFVDWYGSLDFFVYPMHGIIDGKCTCGNAGCNNQGKHPVTRQGFKDAVHAAVIDEVARLFKFNTNYNIAVATGSISGIFVVDIDSAEGQRHWDALQVQHGELPPTLTTITGKGRHYYFQHPGKKVITRTQYPHPGLDIKGDGGSCHLPPSNHINGSEYRFDKEAPQHIETAPKWLVNIVTQETQRKESTKPVYASGEQITWSVDEVTLMLDHLDPNMDYKAWIEVGMGLHDGGYPPALWDNWSSASPKYQKGACNQHWRSFRSDGGISMGSLVKSAQVRGWQPQPDSAPTVILPQWIHNFVERSQSKPAPIAFTVSPTQALAIIPATPAPTKPGTLGFDPLALPGLIGETVRWITRYALYPQPELALFNTLAFAGAVFGRRFASPINTRTNIYMVGVTGTGAGKDHSRKMITYLATQAGLDQFVGSHSIRSESGLARSLETNASQLMMIDEFGLFLQAVGDRNTAPHARQISDLIMKLYSSSSMLYKHGEYADKNQKEISVMEPNLCLYGTTTEETYASSLKKAAILSGNINRYIVCKPLNDKPRPNHDVEIIALPDHLREAWAAFAPKSLGEIVNTSTVKPSLRTVHWGECKQLQRDLLDEQTDLRDNDKYGPLYVRLYENTIKAAMIFAICRDPKSPVFTAEDFGIGTGICRTGISYMKSIADDHMFDSETESNYLEILRYLKANGGQATRSEVCRKMRKMNGRLLNDIISSMIDSGVIEAKQGEKMGGRSPVIYQIC